jgi:pimeloyl-ACP methyl ester carboxylesterase
VTPDRPSDPALRSGWLREGPFSFTDEGEGPVVLALHGLPGSTRDWRWLAPSMTGTRFVRLDQPAFGGTPRSTEPDPRLAARARFVLAAMDAMGLEDVVVLGHSMGGPLAVAVAAAAPSRVRGLALLASVGLRPHRLVRKIGRHPDLPRLLDAPLVGRALMPPLRRGFGRAGFPLSTPDAALRQSMRIASGLSFAEIRASVAEVRCPTLLAWALDDPIVEEAIGLELAAALPEGPRVAFETGGHNVQKSRALELAQAITAFAIKRRSGPFGS